MTSSSSSSSSGDTALVDLQLDPGRAHHITILGRKGSGKSTLARRFWDSYPFDRLAIDPTGDIDATDAKVLREPLPARWPLPADPDERASLVFRADPGSALYRDELDRAVGLAFAHRRCLLWIDEVGELTRANDTPPNFRRALHQSRHRKLSMLLCGPRPIDVNPLVLAQADFVATFDMPNPNDRRRVADSIGLELAELEAHLAELEPPHGYLWYDARARQLTVMPPLPTKAPRRSA